MVQIFLAHANEDRAKVFELYDRLKKKGYKPWLDKEDLLAGLLWDDEIKKAINNSDVFLACLSKRSVEKQGYVQKEYKMALKKCGELPESKIYLIPLRLDDCEIPNLRQREYGINIRDYQWINYFEPDGFQRLIETIDHHFPNTVVSAPKATQNQPNLKTTTSAQRNLPELNSQYFERYDYLLNLSPKMLQALLIEQDQQVKMLARMVDTAIKRPSQTFVNQYHNEGDVTVSEQGSNAPKYDLSNAQFAGGFAETVEGDQVGGTINNQASETPSLTEAAAEIQVLLKQLEQTAPAETMTEKMTLATQAIAQIEANPSFKQRAVAALTAGGMKAFESAIDHPVAAFVVGAIEEWKKS